MRKVFRDEGFSLVAGEYPGGTDHELYPLCVTDPAVARDRSPDPRRHSADELIPDIVAIRGRELVLGEAKVGYNDGDRLKLEYLVGERRPHLLIALEKFSVERRIPELLPVETLVLMPTLIFTTEKRAPSRPDGFSFLILDRDGARHLGGPVAGELE
jgi:hypothetical protein